jgi:hypothetical protein
MLKLSIWGKEKLDWMVKGVQPGMDVLTKSST